MATLQELREILGNRDLIPAEYGDTLLAAIEPLARARFDANSDLVAMFVEDIGEVKQIVDPADVPTWDRPWDREWWNEWPVALDDPHALARFCHAVGSIRGYAATLDVTPLELIDRVSTFTR